MRTGGSENMCAIMHMSLLAAKRLSAQPPRRHQAMLDGLPGQRQVADKVQVLPQGPVPGLPEGLTQIAAGESGVERVQQGAVVENRPTPAALRVSGDLAAVERQVGPAGDGK